MIVKTLSKKEFLKILEKCVDDHKENMQYADDDEFEWRSECIGALEYAIGELGSVLYGEIQIVINRPDSDESVS
jgi:hypothetical protein